MKTISLNVSERLFAITILNTFKGSLSDLAVILEDIKQFPLLEDEWEKAERKTTQVGQETLTQWNDEKGGEKEINLQNETIDYLMETIKEKDKKKEFGLVNRAAITLFEKIK